MVEWSHGLFCTLFELAYWNGLGGYGGKSNWVDDRDEPNNRLWRAMPAELKAPWKDTRAEIRCIDMPGIASADDFLGYLHKYEGRDKRFLDPKIHESSDVRISHRGQGHIMRYLSKRHLVLARVRQRSADCAVARIRHC